MNIFNWEIKYISKNSRARLGKISTPHGSIDTPAFIFCATKGSLKTILNEQAVESKTQIILSIIQEVPRATNREAKIGAIISLLFTLNL